MTKNEVEKLLSKLADKTLSFGCRIRQTTDKTEYLSVVKGMTGTVIRESNPSYAGTVIFDNLTHEILHNCPVDDGEYEVLGHPTMLTDVLEKMRNDVELELIMKDSWGVDVGSYDVAKLLNLWGKCGFTESLQQIYEEWTPEGIKLFTFLNQIFS